MNTPTHSVRPSDRAYAVRRPRPSDAVGESLRRIYDTEQGLPVDIQHLLGRIDRVN